MRCFAYRCRSRARAAREPCQAGNRAALSGVCPVPRQTCICMQSSAAACSARLLYCMGGMALCIARYTANGVPAALPTWWGRPPSSPRCKTRSPPGASVTPTCSPARAAPARPPAPRFLPRRSTAQTPPAPTPAANALSARALRTAPLWTLSRWTLPPTTVWTISATCAMKSPICPRSANTRYISSTRFICCPQRRSTRCSKRWRNRPNTSSLFWRPPMCKRCLSPF